MTDRVISQGQLGKKLCQFQTLGLSCLGRAFQNHPRFIEHPGFLEGLSIASGGCFEIVSEAPVGGNENEKDDEFQGDLLVRVEGSRGVTLLL